MKKIENAWFGNQTNCPESSTFVTSNSLGLNSFWGLFLIAGVTSVSALVIFMATFVYKHRSELMPSDSGPSLWQRVRNLFRKFDQRDLSSHTFRRTDRNVNDINAIPFMVGAISPMVYSVHTEFPGEQGGSSSEHGDPNTNGQSPQHQVAFNIELTRPPVERPVTVETTY
uniref:Uncharacterized protein MANES_16G133600 n=1 Tax=Rhizophora mucronata TaxID=61149 RepID=A0A2P2MQ08_RHIMU